LLETKMKMENLFWMRINQSVGLKCFVRDSACKLHFTISR